MKPLEINLPAESKVYIPNSDEFKALNFNEICDLLAKSNIPEVINNVKTLVIINDAHRSTPSYLILSALSEICSTNKIDKIMIATGTHDKPTDRELRDLIRDSDKKLNAEIVIHDSKADDLIYIGKTTRETEIRVNPIIKKYEQIICINSVEPHYFAGFTGGVKSVIPGLAALTTVEQNHSWALDENSKPLEIWNNPLQLDLWEAVEMLDIDLIGIQLVNVGNKIYSIHTGALKTSFQEAVNSSNLVYSTKVDEPVDIVVSFVYPPLDRSLYQAQKGIENTRQILKKHGTLILVADCRDGMGSDYFYNTLKKYNSQSDVIASLKRETYRFGDHKALKFATLTRDATLFIVSDLTENQVKNVFAKTMSMLSLEDYLRSETRKGKKIAVVLDSGTLVTHL